MNSRTLVLLVAIFPFGFLAPATSLSAQSEPSQVRIEWDKVICESKTTATYQIVVSPQLAQSSRLHDATFRALKGLACDRARLATWYPHPRLTVAELDPPKDGKTSHLRAGVGQEGRKTKAASREQPRSRRGNHLSRGQGGGQIQSVDRTSGIQPPVATKLSGDELSLQGFAISVVTFPEG